MLFPDPEKRYLSRRSNPMMKKPNHKWEALSIVHRDDAVQFPQQDWTLEKCPCGAEQMVFHPGGEIWIANNGGNKNCQLGA